METKGAIKMFLRNIEKIHLKYTQFVGNGYRSSFGNLSVAIKEKYETSYTIVKEPCVGHIQERMGTALQEYTKGKKGMNFPDGKKTSGSGRLPMEIRKFRTTMV